MTDRTPSQLSIPTPHTGEVYLVHPMLIRKLQELGGTGFDEGEVRLFPPVMLDRESYYRMQNKEVKYIPLPSQPLSQHPRKVRVLTLTLPRQTPAHDRSPVSFHESVRGDDNPVPPVMVFPDIPYNLSHPRPFLPPISFMISLTIPVAVLYPI